MDMHYARAGDLEPHERTFRLRRDIDPQPGNGRGSLRRERERDWRQLSAADVTRVHSYMLVEERSSSPAGMISAMKPIHYDDVCVRIVT
jgi:hypothetical protein